LENTHWIELLQLNLREAGNAAASARRPADQTA
jgi:hypothetical protein